jgi:NAD(P)H-dependent flavin oxidoreductase YrpB (nitropropane dioxygenase family)
VQRRGNERGDGEEEPWGRYEVAMPTAGFQGDIEYAPLWAGTSVSDVHDIKPAGEIVRDLVREAEAALRITPSRR